MRFARWFSAPTALALVFSAGVAVGAEVEKKSAPAFGVLAAPTTDAAKAQAQDWLKSAGKADDATQKAFDAVWASDRPLLDKVSDTLALGSPEAAKLLAEVKDADGAAPLEAPALVRDDKQPAYLRSNLALAYAKALSNRKVHDQVLETLKGVKPDQTVDPATYFFVKAVSEHALMQKDAALDDVDHLLSDVADAPERYRTVGALMVFDMLGWKEKGLDAIARKMNAIKDRLDLSRGGEKTQKMQKDVVFRLDEVIKEIENQQKNGGSGSGANCPPGGNGKKGDKPSDNTTSTSPQDDSLGGNGKGPGNVDMKKVADVASKWGKLPEKERADALRELTRDLPADQRETVEKFFQELSRRGER